MYRRDRREKERLSVGICNLTTILTLEIQGHQKKGREERRDCAGVDFDEKEKSSGCYVDSVSGGNPCLAPS